MNVIFIMIRLVLLAIAFLLAGCGHMPVTSMIRLARADLAATDPAQLRAAVKLPRVLKLKPAGVALRIGVKLANGEEDTQDFVLREVSDPADVVALHAEPDRKSTRLNSSHLGISYAVFCLKKTNPPITA